MCQEKTKVRERATDKEKTNRGERATTPEKTTESERAIRNEKTNGRERAISQEKTMASERATDKEKTIITERKGGDMKALNTLVDATLAIEKLRVAAEVRQSHFRLQGKEDIETNELHRRLRDLEDYTDGRVAELIQTHPAYPWFSRVKGIGKENIGKVVGLVDIERANTISGLWKFAGFSVENGASPKRTKGEKLSYNNQLRSMCWRLGSSLLRARGKFYDYYLKEKDKYYQRYEAQGIKIVPATSLPKDKNGKHYEPDGVLAEGHVHNQALRKMIKLFLACLWLQWREAEGLPVSNPYVIDKLGHNSMIEPQEMTDR